MSTNVKNSTDTGLGAIGDGSSHPLSTMGYATLAAAQADFSVAGRSPVTSLAQETDWAGIMCAILRELLYPTDYGGKVIVPGGGYFTNSPLVLTDPNVIINPSASVNNGVCGLQIEGEGMATVLYSTPLDTDPCNKDNVVFFLINAQRCWLKDFRVVPLGAAFACFRSISGVRAGGGFAPTQNRFSNLMVGNNNGSNYWTRVFSIDVQTSTYGGGDHGNNDLHVIEHCHLSGASDSCIYIEGQNTHDVKIERCNLAATGSGTSYAINAQMAYFYCRDCFGGGFSIADFYLNNFFIVVDIDGWNCENSAMLLWTGYTGAVQAASICHCRWASTNNVQRGVGGRLPGAFIYFGTRGSLEMRNNHFNGPSDLPLVVEVNASGPYASVEHANNAYEGATGYVTHPVSAGSPTVVRESATVYLDNHGVLLPSFGLDTPVTRALQAWFKNDATNVSVYTDAALTTLATTDGQLVGGWKDQSGNAYNATQSNSFWQPTYRLSVQNGLPGIQFNGAAFLALTGPPNNVLGGSSGYVFAVVQFTGALAKSFVISRDDPAIQQFMSYGVDGANSDSIYAEMAGTPAGLDSAKGAVSLAKPQLLEWSFASNGGTLSEYVNGVQIFSGTGPPGSLNLSTPVWLGGRGNSGSLAYPFSGYLLELLVYDGPLSALEVQLVRAYLNRRWGLYPLGDITT